MEEQVDESIEIARTLFRQIWKEMVVACSSNSFNFSLILLSSEGQERGSCSCEGEASTDEFWSRKDCLTRNPSIGEFESNWVNHMVIDHSSSFESSPAIFLLFFLTVSPEQCIILKLVSVAVLEFGCNVHSAAFEWRERLQGFVCSIIARVHRVDCISSIVEQFSFIRWSNSGSCFFISLLSWIP